MAPSSGDDSEAEEKVSEKNAPDKPVADKPVADKPVADKPAGKDSATKESNDKAGKEKASKVAEPEKPSADKLADEKTKADKAQPSKLNVKIESEPAKLPGQTPTSGKLPMLGPADGKTTQEKLTSSQGKDNSKGECPGGDGQDNDLKIQKTLPDDIPLEQQEQPYNAPKVETITDKHEPKKVAQRPALTNQQMRLRSDINRCLQHYLVNLETIARRSPWAVMHTILPFGVEAEVMAGTQRVNAIGWMCHNGICKTQFIFQPTRTGFRANLGPGEQGHEGQFLAVLAQSRVASTYPIRVGKRSFTIRDLIQNEMASCRPNTELTFKLIGLSYYLEQNTQWRDNQGGSWNLERLVAEELEQPIVGAACGGTHRLMALSFSLQQHKEAGLPVTGHWQRSEVYLNDFVQYAFSLQNSDGSFSTNWFEGRAADPDIQKRVQTTGHILEWLVYTLPDEQLESPEVIRAVQFILNTIGREPGKDWPIGPRGHALRAIAIYNQRVFDAPAGQTKQFISSLKSQGLTR